MPPCDSTSLTFIHTSARCVASERRAGCCVTSQANGLFNYLMLEHGAARESKREREAVGGQELSLSLPPPPPARPCVLGNPLMDLPFEPFLFQRITPKAVLLFHERNFWPATAYYVHAREGQKFTLGWKFGKAFALLEF
jgi:hypothetical protein